MEGDLAAVSAARNPSNRDAAAPNMAEYMTTQNDWRRQESRARAARDMRQRAAQRQKDTEEFLAEVDLAMKHASERSRAAGSWEQWRHTRKVCPVGV